MFYKLARIGSVVACLLPVRVAAQEKPLSANAVFSTGYYDTYTRDTADHSVSFVPFGAKFDINGYWMMPDFLSFTAQPELNAGPQASDAGFLGGNGIRLSVTLLRKRSFPLTFHYTNIQMENVSFGGVGQVSADSLRDRTKDLGLTWQLKPGTGLPELLIDWSRTSVHSSSDTAFIPDSDTSSSHLNADSKLERWGWNMTGQIRKQQSQTDLFAPLGVATNTASLGQNLFQYQGSAERTFWRDSDLLVSAGSQSSSNILFGQPLDLSARFANANLRLAPSKRWKNYLRASYTSNLTSALVNQVVSGLATGSPGTIAPDPSLLSALQGRISNVVLNATSNFDIGRGLGVYASVDDGQSLRRIRKRPVKMPAFSRRRRVSITRRGFPGGTCPANMDANLGMDRPSGNPERFGVRHTTSRSRRVVSTACKRMFRPTGTAKACKTDCRSIAERSRSMRRSGAGFSPHSPFVSVADGKPESARMRGPNLIHTDSPPVPVWSIRACRFLRRLTRLSRTHCRSITSCWASIPS